MSLIGNVIKTAIDIKHTLTPEVKDAYQAQYDQLQYLLTKASRTAFGLYYDFAAILRSGDPIGAFRRAVPIHDYDRIHRRWWRRQQHSPDITWPGRPRYFALSSGTTGRASKRIPVTGDMLSSFRSVGLAQIECLSNFDLPASFFEKEVFILSSSAALVERDDHLEGEISGINAVNLPAWFGGFYRPGLEIARIPDWDERIAAVAEAAPQWDIAALAGIPSWTQMMLRQIIHRHGLKHIHDIWPNLQVYVSGGVAFEAFRQSLGKLLGRPLHFLDTYLASEGFFAFTGQPHTLDMQLALRHGIFYEFIPFDERGFDSGGKLLDEPQVVSIEGVEAGQDYALLVSTPAGAWRYLIGDTIRFTDLERYELRISGRTKYFLNVVGSQLSEEKLNAAVSQLAEELEVDINEFAVAAVQDQSGNFIHQWVLGTGAPIDEEQAARLLDATLQQCNKNYAVARHKALKGVRLRTAPTQQLYEWLAARKKKGGQTKVPKVMPGPMMEGLLKHLGSATHVSEYPEKSGLPS